MSFYDAIPKRGTEIGHTGATLPALKIPLTVPIRGASFLGTARAPTCRKSKASLRQADESRIALWTSERRASIR